MQKVTHEEVADAAARDEEELHVVAARERQPTRASARLDARGLRGCDLGRAVDRRRALGDRRRRAALLAFRRGARWRCAQEAAVVIEREAQRAHRQLVRAGRGDRLGLEAPFQREFT